MVFTDQERDIARQIREQGGDRDDFLDILGQIRSKQSQSVVREEEKVMVSDDVIPTVSDDVIPVEGDEDPSSFSFKSIQEDAGRAIQPLRDIGETISDIGQFFKFESNVDDGVIESGLKFIGNLPGNTAKLTGDLITVVSNPIGTAKSVKDLARAGIESGLNKAFKSEGEEIFTSEEVEIVADAVGTEFKRLGDPGRIQELLIENPADVLLSLFGGVGVAKNIAKSKNLTGLASKLQKAENLVNPIKLQAESLKGVGKLGKGVGKLAGKGAGLPFKGAAEAIRAITPESLATKISGIDKIAATVIKKTGRKKLDEVLKIAEDSMIDIENPTAFGKAGDKASELVDILKKQARTAGETKSSALNKVGKNTIETKPILDRFDDLITERFNLKVSDEGKLISIKGKRGRKSAMQDLKGFVDDLQELRESDKITLENLDGLVDDLQDGLNRTKLERPGAQLTTVEKTINSFIEGDINKTLKEAAGETFKKANKDFREIITLVQDLEKMLGKRGVRAEGLFKSLFSPQTGERARQLFKKARGLTGVNLADEAVLAKFAMEALGDSRGLGLLEAASGLERGFYDPTIIQDILKTVFTPEKIAKKIATK